MTGGAQFGDPESGAHEDCRYLGARVQIKSALRDDIAYSLAATEIRIQAPIPGKTAVGVEVPNPKARLVTLREVLQGAAWAGQRPGRSCAGDDRR